MRNATVHMKFPDSGEKIFDTKMFNNELALMIVATAGDAGVAVVDYGALGPRGWKVLLLDRFATAGGDVVILEVSFHKVSTQAKNKHQRPRSPSRSPRRKKAPESGQGRRIFGQDSHKSKEKPVARFGEGGRRHLDEQGDQESSIDIVGNSSGGGDQSLERAFPPIGCDSEEVNTLGPFGVPEKGALMMNKGDTSKVPGYCTGA